MTRTNGYCSRPEWADEQPCPLDAEKLEDCQDCEWWRETEE